MKRWLLVLFAVLVLLLLIIVAQVGETELRRALTAAGCHKVAIEHQALRSRSVLSISVAECVDVAGEDVATEEAWEKIARVAWSSPATRFDTVFATVYQAAADSPPSGAKSHEFSRLDLERRWGPRPGQLDWVFPGLVAGPWLVLLTFSGIVMTVAVPIALGIISARRGVVLFYWRER
jgi:hypothetical protein